MVLMILIPMATPDEVGTIGKANGGKVELRIGRTASQSVRLSADEARRLAEALMAHAKAEGSVDG